jgi:F-type H+-transporting ATPase subunit delta
MTEIGSEYGKALFLLAAEEENERTVYESLCTVQNILEENPLYRDFLSSPHIPLRERKEALNEAFGGKIPAALLNFLKLLCEKGRVSAFEKAKEEFHRLLLIKEQKSAAKITSAAPLTEEEKDAILKKLETVTGYKMQGEFLLDPKILGGVIVETDGKILDGSLKSRLKEAKEVISR